LELLTLKMYQAAEEGEGGRDVGEGASVEARPGSRNSAETPLNPSKLFHSLSIGNLFSAKSRAEQVAARHSALANAELPPSRPPTSVARPTTAGSRPRSAQLPTHGMVNREEVVGAEALESHPNWLPGLPLPAAGQRVEPPRNRSKSARTRYLSQLQSYNSRR